MAASDQRFPRTLRVRLQTDFDRAYASRSVAADNMLVVHGSRNGLEHSRLGLSVSRKVGRATVRNRWKRLIREAFRRRRASLPAGYDFVVRPRRGAAADYRAVAASLPRLARQLAKRLDRETPSAAEGTAE